MAVNESIDAQLDRQRKKIHDLLAAGLETDWQHRAYSDAEIQRVVQALQALPPDDLQGQLRIAGFTLTAYVSEEDPDIEQACATCMYYITHSRYCALPELKLGVEPEWSCNVWRI